MRFTYDRVSLCILIVSRSWTRSRLLNRELHYHCAITTYCDVLTQLLHTLLEYTIQHTTYLLPRGLLSRLSRSMSPFHNETTNHSNCTQPLGCDPSELNATLSHTCWQVGFAWKSAPPVTFHCPVFLAARRTMFFPIHLLHSYNHRSYQWSLPRGSEQACLTEPLLADLCRHTSVGCVTTVILRKRRTAYRSLSTPWILIQLHTYRNWTCRHC